MHPATDDSLVFHAAQVDQAGHRLIGPLTLTLTERRIAVIGRNGAGKSSFLRLASGLIAPTEGRVTLGGSDPFRDRRKMLTLVGILFQNPDQQIIFPTVAEELAFGLRQQGRDKAEARDMVRAHLARLGRANWETRLTQSLSQGQKQWLCLQAVLLMRPRVILLDEPFASLDLPTRMRLVRELSALSQRLVTVTHDPAAAAGADRVIWLEEGRVAADGAADNVLPRFHARMSELGGMDADPDPSA